MHLLTPTTPYKLVTVTLAVPAELEDSEITDGLNGLLNETIENYQDDGISVPLVADWGFPGPTTPPNGSAFPIRVTSQDPAEGEVFPYRVQTYAQPQLQAA
jgi:hypothetical protein